MTKYDYLIKLKHYLQPLPPKERSAALRHYDNFFSDAGPENEYKVMQSLGSPKELANKILNDKNSISGMLNQTRSNVKKASSKIDKSQRRTILLFTILLSPLWISILFLGVCAFAGLFLAAAGAVVCMLIGGIVLLCMGIPYIFNTLPLGLFLMGIGMILASAACLIFSPVMNFVFFIFKSAVKGVISLFNKLIGRKAVRK